MRKFTFLLFAILTFITFSVKSQTITTYPYTQDFEGTHYWTSGGTSSTWALGTPAGGTINSAASGVNSWMTGLSSNYNNSEDSYVESPYFDFTSLNLPIVEFKFWYASESGWDGAQLQVSLDSGATWLRVGSVGDPNNWYNNTSISGFSDQGWSGSSGGWLDVKHTLDTLGGHSAVKFRVRFGSDGSVNSYDGVAFDDFMVYDSPANDLAMVAHLAPLGGCGMSANDTVTVKIFNSGTDNQVNVPVSYSSDGGATYVNETITDTIFSGDTLTYTFTNTVDLTAIGTYNFVVVVSNPGDNLNMNDTLTFDVVSMPTVSAFPYYQDFEGTQYWVAGGTSNVSWALGTPAGSVINSAASGVNAWETGLSSNYSNNTEAYVESPCFDFTSLQKPIFEFDYNTNMESCCDEARLEASVDGGLTWIVIGANGDPYNWYNSTEGWRDNTNGWLHAKHEIDTLAGYTDVKLRIYFSSDGSVSYEGFAFDNINIYDTPHNDLVALSASSPVSGCMLSANETVSFDFYNAGLDTIMGNIPVLYSLDGGATFISAETCADTLAPMDTITYSFTTPADLSTVGVYNIVVVVDNPGDELTSNDTITFNVLSKPVINTYPYYQNFEGTQYWSQAGQNSSWQLGTPAASIINSAASGTKSWVTNLTGYNNPNEKSYVESPCFDFSSLTLPILTLDINYNTSFSNDGANLQVSLDSGATWTTVGVYNDPDNWYNDNTVSYLIFTGSQEGWTDNSSGWLQAKHTLDTLGGKPSVKFRINFGSGGSTTYEGFAFDNFSIYDSPHNDLTVIDYHAPQSSCSLSSTDTITIDIFNAGLDTIMGNIPVTYSIDSGATFISAETINDTLAPGDTLTYTFATTADLSNDQVYNIFAVVSNPGDELPINDTLIFAVENFTALTSINEDFETFTTGSPGTFENGWVMDNPSSYRWQVNAGGTSSSNTGPTIDHTLGTSTGIYVYTEASSGSQGNYTTLTSPCLDLSSMLAPGLSFWYHMYGADIDTLAVDVFDGGVWYNNIYLLLGQQQTQQTDPWQKANLSLMAYPTADKIRFRAIRGSSYTGDIAIDDIQLYELPSTDLGIYNIQTSSSGCGMTNADTIKVTVINEGAAAQSNFDLTYSLDSGLTYITPETYTGTLNPGDTLIYSFTTLADFSAYGVYNIFAVVNLTGDTLNSNDTTISNVNSLPLISTFPYTQDFEGPQYWTSYGINNNWEIGDPEGAVIDTANSGTKCWETGLASNYANSTEAYVMGPCFDFSSLTQPMFEFYYNTNMESCCDEVRLEASIDGGVTWTVIGAQNDPINWYNSTEGWRNNTSGWVYAKHALDGLGGQPDVKLRIYFSSDGSVNYEGFAFDDIRIFEAPLNDAGIADITEPTSTCEGTDYVTVKLKNFGYDTLYTCDINWKVNGALQTPVSFNDTLPVGADTIINLGTYSFATGLNYNIETYTSNPNGMADDDTTNDYFAEVDTFMSTTPYPDPTVIALQDTICGNWNTATFVASGSTASSYIFWTDSLAGSLVGITPDTLTTDTIHVVNQMITYWVEANDYVNDSLITTFAAGNGSSGNMFDVTVTQAVTIDSFSVNVDGAGTASIYYRLGSYVGHETTAADWTLLGTGNIVFNGANNPSSVTVGGLQLSPGQTYGIYVDVTSGINYTNGASSSTIYSDGVMSIDAGVGLGGTFSSVFSPRIWNGIVWYSQGNPCAASNRVPVSVYADSCVAETDIITFSIPQETGPATINHATKNIHDEVASGSGLTSLTPTITVSQGATISPASGVTQDFTNPVMYTVTGFDGSQSIWMVTVTEAPLNIDEIIDGNKIAIVPNPNKGIFTVNIFNDNSSKIKLELMNVEGQVISNDLITVNNKYTQNYDVSHFAKGIYYLKISTDNTVKVKKVIVQ